MKGEGGQALFEPWHDFYLMLGPAASALIGLLFVVVSLAAEMQRGRSAEGTRIYTTPTVFHLAVVMLVSGVALAPGMTPLWDEALILACAAAGLVYAARVGWWIRTGALGPSHWSDIWCYAVMIGAVYLALCAAGLLITLAPALAPHAIAVTLMALLLLAIRNAWDLVTYIAPLTKKAKAAQDADADAD